MKALALLALLVLVAGCMEGEDAGTPDVSPDTAYEPPADEAPPQFPEADIDSAIIADDDTVEIGEMI